MGEGEGEMTERLALKHVHYHMQNRWPVHSQCMKQGTQNQCCGTTQRDSGEGDGKVVQDEGGHMYTCG